MRTSALIVLLALSQLSSAAVYVYTDQDGNKAFTDTPPDDVATEQVEIQESNTLETPPDQLQKNARYFDDLKQQQEDAASSAADTRKQRSQAKKAVAEAQEALEKAKVIVAGDLFPTAAGGVRYTQQYTNRVNAAESALSNAQAAYSGLK